MLLSRLQSLRSGASTSPTPQFKLSQSERDRLLRITTAIREASLELRSRHPFLRHQSAIGLGLFSSCVLGTAILTASYVRGSIPGSVCALAVAVLLSIVHEIEHDLIHNLYFKRVPLAQNLMLLVGWVLRPNTINPWIRRELHLNHHRVSGTEDDIEERAITNGEPLGLKRIVMMADGLCAIVLRLRHVPRGRRLRLLALGLTSYAPFGFLYFGLWYAVLVLKLAAMLGIPLLAASGAAHVLHTIAVVWLLPNFVRSLSINFISSNMHYYGDVQRGNLLEQTQVLNVWYLLPFQLFCFNFGSTHAIHHYVAGEPFYIRQWTARTAHRVMRENGVRFNDLGTFERANRYGSATQAAPALVNRRAA